MRGIWLLFLIILTLRGSGTELGEVVARLKEPTLEQAKLVLADLDQMIAEGDVRTVTLGKKMRRSIRRLFTSEFQMSEARKKAEAEEGRAKQLDENGRKWLRPNVHGRVNKIAAQAAFDEAREIRLKAKWAHEELAKEWREEVADFEKMLGDLEFSMEEEALLTLATMLEKIVMRSDWPVRPRLKFGAERLAFLRARIAGRDRWLLLAGHASDAGDFELAYDLYRKAGSDPGRFRVGALWAGRLSEKGLVGSAINLWERVGEVERAQALLAEHPHPERTEYQVFSVAGLARNVAPACVRIKREGGYQSGFFVKPGGYVATCRDGLRDGADEIGDLEVLLDDGRVLSARIVGESRKDDLVLLKVDLEAHEVLPVGLSEEVEAGQSLTLFGFGDGGKSVPDSQAATVLAASQEWRGREAMRLALDGRPGQAGGPLVDVRGRVMGVFLTSKTGAGYALGAKAIRDLLPMVE